ncbi:ParB N-terminal domain-containing protein [Sphingomonas sp. ID1715]|jgi:ParB family chromosome partitioning protein|uniref:ParB/RepB/Spo0J family partition protein n=1 Tax=Sphingomonadales TaxID=204457 RepID=UPI0007312A43|nr:MULTISPECIES: ParB N-terminal domain-containing protein [Sphingomonadales]KTE26416.1 chromosome partitioning protein ParB [Sphingopyxis sp. H057]KTE52820.1 chromosome partitioning protein ParB [Sphingopyxis sp. H073]KTE55009.1 chromosome partitioning protein ParB [Sphingopyxis sp. H071]KTE62471.1 chromosome partitioning protein ParB [Sphingopyxis sp. H107]KTE66015.1 chromosome partitioning protein ParB [Sphingopyxis sp. H100]
MKLDFIDLGKLSVSKANMRYAKKAPDVSDILPTVRARGVLVPLIVRPNCGPDAFEIVAGARRFTAAQIVAGETGSADPLPCAILENGDDAAAIEASLIENIARLAPDEVTRWETFTRLVKEGRDEADISATFGIPELGVKRILALGNLLPRIRDLYRKEEINAATVRHLTLASTSQQKAWLALFSDPDAYCPTGHQLKDWLFGGASIKVEHALFDVERLKLAIIADLFGEDRFFADADAFWREQDAAIEDRREAYLDEGWSDVVIVPRGEYFHRYEFVKAPKRKGARVYIDVRASGEVDFYEGYVTSKEAKRLERGEPIDTAPKVPRPEVTSTMQTYIDLHRHAAVRAALTRHPKVALRLMVAHAIVGSPLWTIKPEPQTARNDLVAESVETCRAETDFDTKRRAVLDLLGFSPEEPTVAGGNGDDFGLVGVFLRLLDVPDRAVMDVVVIVMGETLASGSAAVEAVGGEIGVDMARYWQADDAFFECVRDKEVLTRIVAEVAGEPVAAANAKEPGKVLKRIVRDHLDGTNGRPKVEGWVPKWMAFPPAAYTARGGVGTVAAHAKVLAARPDREPEPTGPGAVIALPAPAKAEPQEQPEREAA